MEGKVVPIRPEVEIDTSFSIRIDVDEAITILAALSVAKDCISPKNAKLVEEKIDQGMGC